MPSRPLNWDFFFLEIAKKHILFCLGNMTISPLSKWAKKFPNKIVFLSLKISFVLAKSIDSDEMLHHATFHLDLHCLPKYTFR